MRAVKAVNRVEWVSCGVRAGVKGCAWGFNAVLLVSLITLLPMPLSLVLSLSLSLSLSLPLPLPLMLSLPLSLSLSLLLSLLLVSSLVLLRKGGGVPTTPMLAHACALNEAPTTTLVGAVRGVGGRAGGSGSRVMLMVSALPSSLLLSPSLSLLLFPSVPLPLSPEL